MQYSCVTRMKKKTQQIKPKTKTKNHHKTDGTYQIVQDLREVKEIVKDIHPVVASMVCGIGFKGCILLSAFSQRTFEFICI